MKKLFTLAVLLTAIFFSTSTIQANPFSIKNTNVTVTKEPTSVTIQTNALTEKSNAIFESKLPFVKGVKEFKFDVKTSKITVTYDAKKTNPDAIRQAISKLGFNADNVAADKTARAKLPAECKTKACAKSCCGHKH